MPSPSDIAVRLRQEVLRIVEAQTGALQAGLRELQGQIATSLGRIENLTGGLKTAQLSESEAIISQALQQVATSAAEQAKEAGESDLKYLARFAHDVRKKETQEEILGLLLDAAARFSPCCALFVRREGGFQGWSSRGFPEATAVKVSGWSGSAGQSPFLEAALGVEGLTSISQLADESHLSQLFGEMSRPPWHAFPLKAIRRPVAVLLAASAAERSCKLEALCVLMDLTGLSIENLALKILQEMKQDATTEYAQATAAEPAAAAPEPAASPAAEPVLSQVEPAAEEEAVAEAEPVSAAPHQPPAEPEQVAAEPDATEAIEVAPQEALVECAATADAPAELPVETAAEPESASAPAALPSEADGSKAGVLREVQPPTEEEKLHSEARRFARLLVQEIKLYNEQQVADGRTHCDLYLRLKRDIDRSRDMYEKRISPAVAKKVDYFHDEVVRVLAENDPARLGLDYPGPRVVE